jgi:hypothetical protein
MTKREREQRDWMQQAVERLGFTSDEFHALRRISMTLHRWHERERNGEIERMGDDGEGRPFTRRGNYVQANDPRSIRFVADRERGALKRLAKIMEGKEGVLSYVQGDPRGAALYLVPVAELRGQSIESVYSRGVAVY